MKKQKITHGLIYEGPSLLGNGAEIVVLAINKSNNDKTGNMVQTYILNKHIPPITAQKTEQDDVNCGNCKHRNKSCYVRVEQGVNQAYRGYMRGNYTKLTNRQTTKWFKGQRIRMGTYGDPAAITGSIWRKWLSKADGNTGYTHQWRTTDLKDMCMASTDTNEEYLLAKSMGWRCFNVMNKNQQKPKGKSTHCPASKEMGKKLQCIDCMACNGTQNKATSDVMIEAHGIDYKVKKFAELTMIGA